MGGGVEDTNLIHLNIAKHVNHYFFQVTLMIYYFDAVVLPFGSERAIGLSASSISVQKTEVKRSCSVLRELLSDNK